MKYVTLINPESLKLLARIYKQSQKHHVRRRAHCILLSAKGYPAKKIADILDIYIRTVYNRIESWETNGFVSLYNQKGQGAKPKLKEDYYPDIKEMIKESSRSLKNVCHKIYQRWSISISPDTLREIANRLNFSWRRIRKSLKKKQSQQRDYQEKLTHLTYLKALHKEHFIDIYYADESSFSLIPCIPYAWQEAGQYIGVPTAKGKPLNVLGFMNTSNELHAYCFEKNINTESVIACFDNFAKKIKFQSVVVIDNASIHTSKLFQEQIPRWKKDDLYIFQLPKYSPHLNLIEILWRKMKYEWIDFSAYESWQNLCKEVERMIRQFGKKLTINFA